MSHAPELNRIEELLAEEAVFGLPLDLRSELDTLLVDSPEQETIEFEQAAAVYYMAAAPLEIDTMPEALRQRVLNNITANLAESTPEGVTDSSVVSVAARSQSATSGQSAASGASGRVGWLLAMAASLLIGLWLGNPAKLEEQSLAAARSALLESNSQLTQVAWTATETPEAEGATGEVVWSDADQKGFMTFRGLAPNDPSKEQYQLWIFDAERDDKYPVDGGVFDIPEGAEEVITPILAKIAVDKAVLFAITIEKPGGVVVSDRSRLPLLAKVE